MKALFFIILSTILATTVTAQPPANDSKIDNKSDGDPKLVGSVFLIVCDAKPGQVIVLDQNGKWISSVKGVEIKFDVGKSPTITCVIYEGLFRPSNPQTKTWVLAQMKTVASSEFQKMVDSLQTDPEAIKSMLKD